MFAITSVSAQAPAERPDQRYRRASGQSPQMTMPQRAASMGPAAYSQNRYASGPAGYAQQNQVQQVSANSAASMQLQKLNVPPEHASAIATQLSLRYQDLPGVTIAPDASKGQLVVMAPAPTQARIATEVRQLVAGAVRQAASVTSGPLTKRLQNISWREFERDLKQVAGPDVPVTSRNNGNQVTFRLNVTPMQGTLVEVDRRTNQITVRAPEPTLTAWDKMIGALDSVPVRYDDITKVHRLENAEMAPVQRTMRMLQLLRGDDLAAVNNKSVFQNAVMQPPAGNPQAENAQGQSARIQPDTADTLNALADAGGPLGNVKIEYVPQLGQIIVIGPTQDVQRVMELIKVIESKAELSQPDSEVVPLKHADSNAVAELLQQLYDDFLSTRQGDVSISSLDSPNALLLIGRAEAIASLKELIQKIDQPVDESSRLRVFRLQHASAIDAQDAILTFFSTRPTLDDNLRPGLGARVRVSADYRTNSLIVSAAPRDMTEVTRLINELDVQEVPATSELRVFPLSNTVAEDLATTLTDAFIGGEVTGSEETTAPSTSLQIVAVDSDGKKIVESGILAGATITADLNSNSIVVRAPSTSMPLIAELIRQLDRAPGIDSLVKVFTIQNGDATQLATSLETLFGSDAATSGTQVGAANAAGLPAGSAAEESTLVPLRFSVDIRTNSIVASGSLDDLDVVESILLRLDSEGFAERITEVIWLKNNTAAFVANAITSYVQQRSQSQNLIQQFQTGLGPYDLPDRDLIAIPEENFNSILLSVSPRLYEEVRSLIDRLDRRRPMVLIKVLLAEVNLNDAFEIGTELGLQDSLVFSRNQALGVGTPNAAGELTSANGADAGGRFGSSGFNFNGAGTANVNDFARESLAGAAVSTFGLGQSNSAIGYGGFVLNAASESVSLLFRSLQDAGRAQIISRPQLMTADNTEALVNVGRQIARFRGNDITNNAISQNIEDITVGLQLLVRPRIGSDGTILVEVNITRSDRDDGVGTVIPDGAGGTVLIEDIVDTTAQATLSVYNGQTVIMGGLIQKSRNNFSRRLPYLSNIPILGNLFKYDFESETRSELLVVMTPMLVTGGQDLEYVKQTESSRMSWCLADIVEAHGDVGLSGGYGLWGPAVGPTIYPDLQPTIDGEIVVGELPPGVMTDRAQPAHGQPLYPPATMEGGSLLQTPGQVVPPPATGSPVSPTIIDQSLPAPAAGSEMIPPVLNQSSSRTPAGMMDRNGQTMPASWLGGN
ncbi:MAG: secretin N-terminal domain-containing protein [Planctomycetota bacterium]